MSTTMRAIAFDEDHAPDGVYGPSGWMDRSGVCDLMAPYLCREWETPDYARFEGLGGEDAQTLLDLLPDGVLDIGQNLGPRLEVLLRIAAQRPDVFLSGYLIRAPRADERLTADGLFVEIPDHRADPCDRRPGNGADWRTVRDCLGLPEETTPPDEFLRLPGAVSACGGWWIWWD